MTKTVTTGKATDLITFTRSTTGTYLDSVKYGDELVTNGDFSDGLSNWSNFNAVISVDDGQLVVDDTANAGGDSQAYQDINTTAGKYYKLSFDKISTTSVFWFAVGVPAYYGQVYYSGSLGTQTGQHVLVFKATGPITRIALITSATGITRYDNCSVKEIIGNQGTSGEPLLRTADTNEPRIEYDADGNLKGLLIEEQRTNLISLSNFNNVTKQEVTTVNDYAVAPDGTNTAVAMFETTNNFYHRAYRNPSYLNGSTYTQSVFLKSIGGRAGQLTMTSSGFGTIYANFDLVNGVVGTKNNCESQITPVGNGWYRCSITATAIADATGDASVVAVTSPTSARLENYAGDTSKGLLVYGLQVETGSFPTSYIPTSGSTVTRNADVASINVSEFEFVQQYGTLIVEGTRPYAMNTSESYASLAQSSTNRFTLYIQGITNYLNGYTRGQTGTNVLVGPTANIGGFDKWGMTYHTQDGFVLAVNGSQEDTATTANADFVGKTALWIGNAFSGATEFCNGHIKSVKYYPVRLTDNQLKALTQ